jgi:phosphatidylglycerophosphatase A
MMLQNDDGAPSRLNLPVILATGLGLGLIAPAPGTVCSLVWGLPLAWAVGQLPDLAWQFASILAVNVVGIPLASAAGHSLGGEKDNQAIVFDEIATVPLVFLFVPLSSWKSAVAGFLLHRLLDITKPPPARQLERLPGGLGVMADDWMAGLYACALLAGLAWLDRAAEWGLFAGAWRLTSLV